MKTLEEIIESVVHLKYDMRAEFTTTHDPQILTVLFYLHRADGSSELAGKQRVSVQFMQQVPEDIIKAQFQAAADLLIADLAK